MLGAIDDAQAERADQLGDRLLPVIVDSSLVIDAVADSRPRGMAARHALGAQPAAEPLRAPGHPAFEIMSGLSAAAITVAPPGQPAE